MRILADGVIFQNTDQRGIQRYGRELYSRLAGPHSIDLAMTGEARVDLPQTCAVVRRSECFPAPPKNLPLRAWRKLRRRFLPTRVRGHDVYHSTFFRPSPEPGIPEVVTLYDMIPESFPEFFPGSHDRNDKRRAMERATKVLCISHATAADAGQLYPHIKAKLCVIHLGAEHLPKVRPAEGDGLVPASKVARPYVIFVGDRHLYKNFVSMLAAVADPIWPTNVDLIVVGKPPTVDETDTVGRRCLGERVRFVGFVPDPELRGYYQRAMGFVFPSLGEGFGFPQLEAQSQGVPVLCSDLPVFREVSGDAAIYFDPNDPSSIARAVASLQGQDVRDLVERGFRNVDRFRWDDCAAQTLRAFEAVAT